jgi:hypothetical protein
MTRTTLNFFIDLCLLLLFISLLFTAVVVQFIFPAGISAQGWELWGLGYGSWCNLQFGLLAGLALLVLLHVMLHWSWVCGVIASWLGPEEGKKLKLDDGAQTLYGVGLLICLVNLLGLAIGAAALCIRSP